MNNNEYIKKYMSKPEKKMNGRWSAYFTCKDGFTYSAECDGNLRVVKPQLLKKICYLANLGKHPVQ